MPCKKLSIFARHFSFITYTTFMTKRQKNGLILILGIIAALGPFTIDMYLPGFTAIAKDFNVETSELSYTLTSYFIGICVGQLIYGPILDRVGRKKPLLFGLGLYLIGSIGCSMADGVTSLVWLRLLQALGGCVGMVASRAIVRDRFDDHEIADVFSTLMLVMGAAPILAPTVGGYIISHFGWRTIFILLSCFSGLLILLATFFLKESKAPDKAVSYKLSTITGNYIKVLKNSDFLMYGLAGSISMGALFTYIAAAPPVLMDQYHLEPKTFGIIFGCNAAAFIGGSQINRLFLKYWNEKDITYVCAWIFLVVSALLFAFTATGMLNLPLLLASLFIILLTLGVINPNSSALALVPFTKMAGVASALIGSYRMLAGAVTSGVVALLANGTEMPMVAIILISAVIVFFALFAKRRGDVKRSQEEVELKEMAKA